MQKHNSRLLSMMTSYNIYQDQKRNLLLYFLIIANVFVCCIKPNTCQNRTSYSLSLDASCQYVWIMSSGHIEETLHCSSNQGRHFSYLISGIVNIYLIQLMNGEMQAIRMRMCYCVHMLCEIMKDEMRAIRMRKP